MYSQEPSPADLYNLAVDTETTLEWSEELSPLNINTVTEKELRAFTRLHQSQISSLLQWRRIYGGFRNIFELQTIPDLDSATISQLLAIVRDPTGQSALMKQKDGYIILRSSFKLNQRYSDAESPLRRYPAAWLMKMRKNWGNGLSAGITAESDPGEPFIWNQGGFDFISGYISLRSQSSPEVIAGDFQIRTGQGLVLGGNRPLFAENPVKRGISVDQGLRSYNSTLEYGFFRGLAVSGGRDLKWTVFFSRRGRDATLDTVGYTGNLYFRSLSESGLHRTKPEQDKRRQVRESNTGFDLSWNLRNSFRIGISGVNTWFNYPFQPDANSTNDTHSRFSAFGPYFQATHRNMLLFTEYALSQPGRHAIISGLLASLSPHLDIGINYRYFQNGFRSIHATTISRYSGTENESGLYFGVLFTPLRRVSLGLSTDHYQRLEIKNGKYFNGGISTGADLKIEGPAGFSARVRFRSRLENYSEFLQSQITTKRSTWSFTTSYPVNPNTELVSHFHLSSTVYAQGNVFAQDIKWESGRWNLRFRAAVTDIGDWDNRVYVYENDLLYSFSIPAYHGKGVRYYLLIRTKLSHRFRAWLKLSSQRYYDRRALGSGISKVNGNVDGSIRIQLRYSL